MPNHISKSELRGIRRVLKRHQGPDRLATRAVLADYIASHAEHGHVAIVHSGRDCDGTSWSGVVVIIQATVIAVESWADNFDANAEGWQSWYIDRPSAVDHLEPEFRDLVLEAFEAGHPHCLHA